DHACGSMLAPKLVGSYETEIQPFVRRILQTDYRALLDVGCAEGYYAVGFAARMPLVHVYAFDIDPEARRLCAELAQKNGVLDRIDIRERCDPEALRYLPITGALIVSDCEGYEQDLLRPDLVPDLRFADVLVELHEGLIPGI